MTALLVSRKRPLSHDYVAATCFAEVCCACCGLCESRDLLRVLRHARAWLAPAALREHATRMLRGSMSPSPHNAIVARLHSGFTPAGSLS